MKTFSCDFAGGDSKITACSGTRARGLCQTVCRVGDCLHRASCVQGFSQCVHVYLTTSTTISFAYIRARICGHTNKHARASARDHTLIHIERRKHRPALTPFREQKGEGKLRSQLQTLEADTKSLSIPKRSPSAGILEELQDGKEKEGGADVPALENHVRALQQLVSCAHAREYYMHQLRKHARK